MSMTIQQFIKERPHLVWYVKDLSKLDEASIVEHVLNYGDWDDVQTMIKILGMGKVASIFRDRSNLPRSNYRPEIKNYFQLYFQKYATHA